MRKVRRPWHLHGKILRKDGNRDGDDGFSTPTTLSSSKYLGQDYQIAIYQEVDVASCLNCLAVLSDLMDALK